MAEYNIYLSAEVEKDLSAIPQKNLKKILYRIALLSHDTCPLACEKLSDQERYRIRQGKYRIVYSIQEKALTVSIVKIGHRKDLYR